MHPYPCMIFSMVRARNWGEAYPMVFTQPSAPEVLNIPVPMYHFQKVKNIVCVSYRIKVFKELFNQWGNQENGKDGSKNNSRGSSFDITSGNALKKHNIKMRYRSVFKHKTDLYLMEHPTKYLIFPPQNWQGQQK